MATSTATVSTRTATAIELPTNRTSKYYEGPGPDVHDPNYIPVLNGAEIKVDFSKPSFSAFPSIPTPHTNASQTSLKRSKSGSAPEIAVARGNDRNRHSRNLTSTKAAIPSSPQELEGTWEPELSGGNHETSSDLTDNRTPSDDSDASTSQADPGYGENIFVIPGNEITQADIAPPRAPTHSARSSIASSKRVPTSRFNKRASVMVPLPQTNGLHTLIAVPAPIATPPAVPGNVGVRNHSSRVSLHQQVAFPTASQTKSTAQLPSTIPVPPTPAPPPAQPALRGSKSTASERRNRALHSHPSNQSLASRNQPGGPDTDELPLIPPKPGTASHRQSSETSRSRAHSICNSTQAAPAPNSPLPDLPVGAGKRPPTRERQTDKSGTHKSSSKRTQESEKHVEMSDFMTSQKSVVFRRFDDVHIKLLLHLQDEIASLEKELVIIENGASMGPEQAKDKMSIMRELRKTIAEYDNMFANWASMQANPASQEMKDKLAECLQKPGADVSQISSAAREDVACLLESHDLSCVSLDPEKKESKEKLERRKTKNVSNVGSAAGQGSSGGGGILSFFGCASRRK